MAEELKPMDDAELYDDFAKWWEDDGQYVRAGGCDYERSFAFQAFRHLMPQIAALHSELEGLTEQAREKEKDYYRLQSEAQNLSAQLPSQGGETVEVFNFDHELYGQISNGWPDEAIELIDSIPTEPLMTVAQHQRIVAGLVPADSRVVPVELLVKLLDEGRRAETWAAQDELRALLGVKS